MGRSDRVADIFDEVDEELRQERAARLWRQYGSWLIAAALAVVIAVGGYRYWQYYQANERAAAAAE
ncbi:MAG: tetratricopeptide repeat protein, partial [Pseudomonadota bacterium]|nr:tetratricopeptide repeat protein [Pseudomonadota bacterium]